MKKVITIENLEELPGPIRRLIPKPETSKVSFD
jgi:hypothetical protein